MTQIMPDFCYGIVVLLFSGLILGECQLFGSYGVKWSTNLKSRDYNPESRLLLEVSLQELHEHIDVNELSPVSSLHSVTV